MLHIELDQLREQLVYRYLGVTGVARQTVSELQQYFFYGERINSVLQGH